MGPLRPLKGSAEDVEPWTCIMFWRSSCAEAKFPATNLLPLTSTMPTIWASNPRSVPATSKPASNDTFARLVLAVQLPGAYS